MSSVQPLGAGRLCDCQRRMLNDRGSAYVFSLVLMVVLLTVSTTLLMSSTVSVINSDNATHIHEARFLAEGGIQYMRHHFETWEIPTDVQADDLLNEITTHLQTTLGASIESGTVTKSGNTVTIPAIRPDADGGTFSAEIHFENDDPSTNTIRLSVTGSVDSGDGIVVERSIVTEFQFVEGTTGEVPYEFAGSIFAYGVATNGPINMTGGTFVQRWNRLENTFVGRIGVYTGYGGDGTSLEMQDGTAVVLQGGPWIEGTVTATDPDAQTRFSGNPSINGVRLWDWNANIDDQVITGVPPQEFPHVNTSVFEPFVPDQPSEHVSAYNDPDNFNAYINTLDSIRIGANTNPNISSDTTINGIIYVEAPNKVNFTAGATLNGIIVTEDGSEYGDDQVELKFNGGFNHNDVTHLPPDAKYDGLRNLNGAGVLAPGFNLVWSGGANAVGGTIYGKSLTMSGGAIIRVHGSVLMTSDQELRLTGGSGIENDLTDLAERTELPPGFYYVDGGVEIPGELKMVSGYWREY